MEHNRNILCLRPVSLSWKAVWLMFIVMRRATWRNGLRSGLTGWMLIWTPDLVSSACTTFTLKPPPMPQRPMPLLSDWRAVPRKIDLLSGYFRT